MSPGAAAMTKTDEELDCDYLVVGAGARGLAFVDTLLTQARIAKKRIKVAIVDWRGEPGGHWNDAYRFARLHHQSAHYGVDAKALEKKTEVSRQKPTEAKGGKATHFALPSEILAYFSEVMDEYVESGCVQFFPLCTFRNNQVESLMDADRVRRVSPRCKIVITAHVPIRVPSMRPPPFDVGLGVHIVPPNLLPSVMPPPPLYSIIGAGRTAIDAVLWLLSRGAQPSRVMWVMPRDHWLMCREAITGNGLLHATVSLHKGVACAESMADLCNFIEKDGLICRLDPTVRQTCFHGAAVSKEELTQLQRVTNIVRLGRVSAVYKDQMVLEQGVVHMTPGTLHVDCTSSWIRTAEEPVPIWEGRKITLQPVQEVFVGTGEFNATTSAALIGLIELRFGKDAEKNAMLTPGKHPDTVRDWVRMHKVATENSRIYMNPYVRCWLHTSRLSLLSSFSTSELAQMYKMDDDFAGNIGRLLQVDEEEQAELEELAASEEHPDLATARGPQQVGLSDALRAVGLPP